MSIRKKIWQSLKWPLIFVGVLLFTAIFADFLANDHPLYSIYKGQHYFPAFSHSKKDSIFHASGKVEEVVFKDVDWRKAEFSIWPLIPYGPHNNDRLNESTSPFGHQYWNDLSNQKVESPFYYRHHLGTDQHGVDLLAQLIHGSRTSLSVSLLAVFLASLIGILLGTIAAFFGDHKLQTSLIGLIFLCLSLPIAWYYSFMLRHYQLLEAVEKGLLHLIFSFLLSLIIFFTIVWIFHGIAKLLIRKKTTHQYINLPLDSIISRTIELIDSLPLLLLLLTIAAIFKPNLYHLALIIGFTSWTGVARFTRAEVLRISELDYVQAGKAMGFPTWRIMFKHIIPHALTPIWIIMAFSIGNIIISEAALSFIGIGIPDEVISWGKLLPNELNPDTISKKWWTALFPGLAIFFTVLIVNIIGEKLRDILDPKNH